MDPTRKTAFVERIPYLVTVVSSFQAVFLHDPVLHDASYGGEAGRGSAERAIQSTTARAA